VHNAAEIRGQHWALKVLLLLYKA